MAVVDELVTLLTFKTGQGTEQAIKTIKDGISTLKTEVTKWAAMATAAGTATTAFLVNAGNKAVELQKLSQNTNLSTEDLQKWQYAAEAVGASASSVTNDLSSLLKSMSSPIPGQFNQELLMLGVSVRDASGKLRGADEVLKDVGDRLNAMDEVTAIQWAQKIGISSDTLLLLKQGKQGLSELFEEAQLIGAIIPEDAIEKGAELAKSIKTLKSVFSALGNSIALSFAPTLKKVVDNFKQFLIVNADFIRQGLGTIIEGIGKGFSRFLDILLKVKDYFTAAIKPISPFIEKMDGVKVVSGLVTGALTGFLALMTPAIAKFIAIGGAISAVSLIIEDFITYLQGGKSVIGDVIAGFSEWLDQFPELKQDIQAVGDAFKNAFEFIINLIGKTTDAFKGLLPAITGIIGDAVGFIYNSVKNVTEKVTSLLLTIFDGFSWDVFNFDFADLKASLQSVGEVFSSVFNFALELIDDVKEAINNLIPGFSKVTDTLGKITGFISKGAEVISEKVTEKALDLFAGYEGKGSASAIKAPDSFNEKNKEINKVEYAKANINTVNETYETTQLITPPVSAGNTQAEGYGSTKINPVVNNNQTINIMTNADARSVIDAMETEMPSANVVSSGTYGSFIGGY